MNKVKALRIVNAALLLVTLVQVITIIIIFFRIKTPDQHLVFEIHEYNGLLFMFLIAAHVTLNWGWIRANFMKK